MVTLQSARFIAAAGAPGDFPAGDRPEVAFAGRSNVGKSTAINALAGRRRLAFASRTPGRTQSINFYELDAAGRLVDLPGYGYAAAPGAVRAGWERLVGAYFADRACLAGVVLLVDARRRLSPLDARLLDWLRALGAPCLVLLAKADKLSRAERGAALARMRAALAERALEPQVLLFSGKAREGVAQAREHIEQWLRGAHPAAANKKPPAKGNATGGKTP